jgi:competence protein ComEA
VPKTVLRGENIMEDFTVKQWIIIIVLVGTVTFGGGLLLGKQFTKNLVPINDTPQVEISTPHVVTSIKVYVAGAVKTPDVYELDEGSIVKDALKKAGGALDSADLVAINLARKINDGEEVVVPYKQSSTGASVASITTPSDSKININTATKSQLVSLPGIGDVKAQAIIDYRTKNGNFKRIEDIVNVSGIGEKTFESLKDLITVN